MIKVKDLATELGRPRSTVHSKIRQLKLSTVKNGPGLRAEASISDDDADLVRLAVKESPVQQRRRACDREEPRETPAVPGARYTWAEFEAAARQLGLIAKQLRITSLEVEVPQNPDQKVKITYEQNNQGEISV